MRGESQANRNCDPGKLSARNEHHARLGRKAGCAEDAKKLKELYHHLYRCLRQRYSKALQYRGRPETRDIGSPLPNAGETFCVKPYCCVSGLSG